MFKSMRNYFRRVAEGYETGLRAQLLAPFLVLASKLYSFAGDFNRSLYKNKVLKRKGLPYPVISVGNLTWGGTGKTPFVEYLAQKICHRRKTPLILTRGYSHDEAEQFRNHLPTAIIGVGKDRYKVAMECQKKNRIDAAILDDGFQHMPLERNIEIVMINAINPFGNKKIIPQGILREPLERLERATIVVLSHSNLISNGELQELKNEIRKYNPKVYIVDAYLEPLFFYRAKKRARVPLEKLKNERVTTFSGVGTPRSFQMLLTRSKIKPVRNFEFSDHHNFTARELQEVREMAESVSSGEIITTEKDYYRAPELIAKEINPLILATRLRIAQGEDGLNSRLFQMLGVRRE